MQDMEFSSELLAPIERVWAFHESVEALYRLTPPHTRIEVEGEPEPARLGVRYALRIVRNGIGLRWLAEYVAFDPPHCFVDRQVPGRGPFAFWEHEHRFEPTERGTRLIDRVTYEPPFGPLGRIADRVFLRRDIERMFAYRHAVTRQAVERPAREPALQRS